MNSTLENSTSSPTCFPYLTDPTLPTATSSINLLLAVPINSYVLWLMLRGGSDAIASEIFYINLTVLVIIFSLSSAFHFAALFTHNTVFCAVQSFASLVFLYSSGLLLCCICVERFVAVVHPVVFLRYKHLRYRRACCCIAWLVALAVAILHTSLFARSIEVTVYVSLGISGACISVMSFCCVSVLRALKRPGPGEGQKDGTDDGKDMKERAFRIILFNLIVMVGTTATYVTYGVLYLLLNRINPVALQITHTIITTPGFVYPLLYVHKAGKLLCFKVALNSG